MKEEIIKQIERLISLRDESLKKYVESLDSFDSEKGSMNAVTQAGILHDLDRHITNLELEMKRLEVSNA